MYHHSSEILPGDRGDQIDDGFLLVIFVSAINVSRRFMLAFTIACKTWTCWFWNHPTQALWWYVLYYYPKSLARAMIKFFHCRTFSTLTDIQTMLMRKGWMKTDCGNAWQCEVCLHFFSSSNHQIYMKKRFRNRRQLGRCSRTMANLQFIYPGPDNCLGPSSPGDKQGNTISMSELEGPDRWYQSAEV